MKNTAKQRSSHRQNGAKHSPRHEPMGEYSLAQLPKHFRTSTPQASYEVVRPILSISPPDVGENHPLGLRMERSIDGGLYSAPVVSIINPDQAIWLARQPKSALHDLKERIQQRTEQYNYRLSGYLGAVAIFGADRNSPGNRYIGYHLNGDLRDCLMEEQKLILCDFGRQALKLCPPVLPHIAIYTTESQAEVSGLTTRLKSSSPRGLAIELAPPEVIPATPRQ